MTHRSLNPSPELTELFRRYLDSKFRSRPVSDADMRERLEQIRVAACILRALEDEDRELGEPTVFREIERSMSILTSVASGFLHDAHNVSLFEIIESHIDEIRLRIDRNSTVSLEIAVLRYLLSRKPENDWRSGIEAATHSAERSELKETTSQIEQRLEAWRSEVLSKAKDSRKVPARRWGARFKSFGKVLRGAGLGCFDVWLATASVGSIEISGLTLPLPEQPGGLVLTSCISGVGLMIEGVGELL